MTEDTRPYGALNLFQPPTAHRDLFEGALEGAVAKIRSLVPRHGLRNPRITPAGSRKYHYCDADEWVASFWPGQMWLAHSLTGDPALLHSARMRRPYFANVLAHPEWHDHDLGFLFSLSAVADYRLTGAPEARAMAIRAAEALAARWRAPLPVITCWNPNPRDTPDLAVKKPGTIIIDSLQNMALLLWAERETGQESFGRIARMHLDSCLTHLVRDDFSAFHCFEFDANTGAPIGGFTHQGHADDSHWARGASWAIHGFAQAYLYTGDTRYRDASAAMADHIADILPDNGVPPWDYRAPAGAPPDSSAGAVTAAGLYILARGFGDDGAEVHRYTALADRMLAGLVQHCDITDDPAADGLLKDGAAHIPAGLDDTMLPYGDYYYVEALMRAVGHSEFFW